MTDARYPITRNAVLLAAGLVCLNATLQLFVALGTVTLVSVTGIEGILGLGPAIFLVAGALAVFPAGRAVDRFGRMPVIRSGFAAGIAGALTTALGCAVESAALVIIGFACLGAAGSDRAAVARGGGRDVPAGAPRARHLATCSSAPYPRRSSGRSSSARCSPAAI